MTLEEKFRAGVRVIQSLPKDGPYQPSNSTKLKFYGLYKQATEGKATGGRPSVFNIIARAKWDAWNANGNMTKDTAMYEYIEELKKIIETMSFSGDVEEFLDAIGPFYEFVNLQGEDMQHIKEALDNWTSSSSFSSSTNSSANNSPAKEPAQEESTLVENGVENQPPDAFNNPSSTHKLNGHLPNKPVLCSSNSYTAPPAPVHRASLANLKSSTETTNGHAGNDADEVLEIDEVSHEYQIHCEEKVPIDSLNSGTESDKYYSGDSEPEIDIEDRFSDSAGVVLSRDASDSLILPENNGIQDPHSRSRPRSKVEGQTGNGIVSVINKTPPNSDYILKNTIERLNRDVDHILARVRILEAAYATNGSQISEGNSRQMRRKQFLGDLSARSFTLIITWPFVAYFIIKLLKWWFLRTRSR